MSIFDEYERNAGLIKAAERWTKQYTDQPETLGQLIKLEARIERKLLEFYKTMADESYKLVNWAEYGFQVRAAEVEVIVNDDGVSEFDGLFISTVFDDIALATGLGALSGEVQYKIPLGISSADEAIQKAARKHVATLVGKRLGPDGLIIDNPNAAYKVSDATRRAIRESINTSISLGEDIETARKRLTKTIKDPKRALIIAQTETVNAFQGGLDVFGKESGAVGKVSQTNGAIDVCAIYAAYGPVPFNYLYGGKHSGPSYHPRCRCGRRLIYQIEVDRKPGMITKDPVSPAPVVKPVKKPAPKPAKIPTADVSDSKETYRFNLTPTEKAFIDRSGLQVKVDSIGRHLKTRGASTTNGVYIPSEHALYVRPPSTVADKKAYEHTFYHELGHALDFKFVERVERYQTTRLVNNAATSAIVADKHSIIKQRLTTWTGVDDDLKENILKNKSYIDRVLPDGRISRYGIPKKTLVYLRSKEEVFADGYGQYRINPARFKTASPALYNVFKELGL